MLPEYITNNIKAICDGLPEGTTLQVKYDGYGDSGEISCEETIETTITVQTKVWGPLPGGTAGWVFGEMEASISEAAKSTAEDLLGAKFSGWEINEGSQGCIEFTKQGAAVHHGMHTQTTEWVDVHIVVR